MQLLDKEEKKRRKSNLETQPSRALAVGMAEPLLCGYGGHPSPQEPAMDFSVPACPKQTWRSLEFIGVPTGERDPI